MWSILGFFSLLRISIDFHFTVVRRKTVQFNSIDRNYTADVVTHAHHQFEQTGTGIKFCFLSHIDYYLSFPIWICHPTYALRLMNLVCVLWRIEANFIAIRVLSN